MISLIYPVIISVVMSDPNIFFCIAASLADAIIVNLNDIKTLLANGFSTVFIKGKPVVGNGPKILSKTRLNCTISDNWVFDNFTLADELFSKTLRSLETCVLVNNNLCGSLFLSFDERFKFISVPFFVMGFAY